ncbi:MAG TPA: 4a-hydroxytetrahydrobiopterin dehydratase [Gemmatimonadaceae bacterium]|nr:4a-hydroxytetrahydrobiopterin dehydratase [Gemmatimonadaceae bacterium]
MRTKLDDATLKDALKSLPGWGIESGAIVKTFKFATFSEGIGFVQRIAAKADAMDHHPDIDIRYTKIRVALSTHDAGGITDMDVKLAGEVEKAGATG